MISLHAITEKWSNKIKGIFFIKKKVIENYAMLNLPGELLSRVKLSIT